MSKVKIFVVYHKPYHIFKNEVFEPIQTGADFSGIDLGFLKDNTGDNIAQKNPTYGELTAWYWVLKNWLPMHPEVTHVGFCHYRRFLDLVEPLHFFENTHRACSADEFIKLFNSPHFSAESIEKISEKYDAILPPKFDSMSFALNFCGNLFDHYADYHPVYDFIKAAEIYSKKEGPKQLKQFWRDSSFYSCLNFIVRKDIFEAVCTWMLDFLGSVEKECHWNEYTDYYKVRCPAFLAERYFSLWFSEKNKSENYRVKVCPRWFLDAAPFPTDIPWYLSGIKQWLLWKIGARKHKPLPDCLK